MSVPQGLPSGQSAGFTKSSSESWLPESSSESSVSGADITASINMALPRSAISSLIRQIHQCRRAAQGAHRPVLHGSGR